MPGRPAGVRGLEYAVAIEADVAQDERELVGDTHAVGRIVDQQRTVEAKPHLRRGHHVRVIPVESRIAHHEVVGERLAALDLRLRDVGHAVHLNRHAHAMPMDGRRLRQVVGEVHDDAVADVGADERSRDPAVVGPGPDRLAGRHLDIGDAGGQIDFDDRRIGIVVAGLRQLELLIPVGWCQRVRNPPPRRPRDQQKGDRGQDASVACS